MIKMEKFVPISEEKKEHGKKGIELNFSVNDFSALRRWKERPENQLEPDINEIQRFATRGL